MGRAGIRQEQQESQEGEKDRVIKQKRACVFMNVHDLLHTRYPNVQ